MSQNPEKLLSKSSKLSKFPAPFLGSLCTFVQHFTVSRGCTPSTLSLVVRTCLCHQLCRNMGEMSAFPTTAATCPTEQLKMLLEMRFRSPTQIHTWDSEKERNVTKRDHHFLLYLPCNIHMRAHECWAATPCSDLDSSSLPSPIPCDDSGHSPEALAPLTLIHPMPHTLSSSLTVPFLAPWCSSFRLLSPRTLTFPWLFWFLSTPCLFIPPAAMMQGPAFPPHLPMDARGLYPQPHL